MTRLATILRKLDRAKTIKWQEIERLFNGLGYSQKEMAGSRVRFFNAQTQHMVMLHRPHPGNEVKGGALKAVIASLKLEGLI
jgi:predicted RNA binding protein YcfA (HicA-like mRNA interferase family)